MLVLPHAQDELFRPWLDGAWPQPNVLAGRKCGKLPASPQADRASCGFCRQMRAAELQLLRKRDGRASGQKRKLLKPKPDHGKRGADYPRLFSLAIVCSVTTLRCADTPDIQGPTQSLGAPRPLAHRANPQLTHRQVLATLPVESRSGPARIGCYP